ncbi:MAG: hypothetical protein L6R35_005798, partial [Caloplaca aegaea]
MPQHYPSQSGLALPPMGCHALIDYMLQNHEAPTTMVICSSREAFLVGLQSSMQADNLNGNTVDSTPPDASIHPLLIPTIHQLAASSTITIAFTPSLLHLRAYLACYAPARDSEPTSNTFARRGSQSAMLVIYGLLKLHRDTTEYSVQGLSRSLAIAVEAANTWRMRLTLVEPLEDTQLPAPEPIMETGAVSPPDPWSEQVPLLNSSLAPTNGSTCAGRTVEVGAVVARWCSIARPQIRLKSILVSPSPYNISGSFVSEPSSAVVPHPQAMGHLIRKDSVPYAAPACVADRSLCPHGANSPIYAGLQANNIDEPLQPLAPMPFATPLPASMPPPPTSTTMRTSILTLYTSPATSTPSAVPTPSMDPMLRGNPTPPWHLHTSTIIGIAANGVLAISIIPLLIFGLVMKWRLKKAKAFQLGQ